MAEFVLKNNYFQFNGKVKQQISGTAIGTKFAPTYACVFMDQVETDFQRAQEKAPLVWFRYIDYIFFIWTHGENELKSFMQKLNQFHPNLSFTYESSKKEIAFLDCKVNLFENKLTTDLYVKPTDTHQYLDYTSSHPEHTKKSIVYSQTLRLRRICSFETDFLKRKNEMKSWFLKRGYPERLIDKEMKKVKFNHSHFIGKHNSKKGIPLVVTYHPLLKSLSKIISKNLHLLYMDEEVKRVFTPGPMISFRSSRKLSDYLVRAKLYPTETVVGSFKCNKPLCLVCVNVTETNTFSSTVTSKTYKINHKFDCDENCLVYLLTCKHCGIQYVGQTVADFRYRWNNYKDNCRKHSRNENCMQKICMIIICLVIMIFLIWSQ